MSTDVEHHAKPQATRDMSSPWRGERKHLSAVKGTINSAHLIVSALPLPLTLTGLHPCLDFNTGVPAKSSVVASPITE